MSDVAWILLPVFIVIALFILGGIKHFRPRNRPEDIKADLTKKAILEDGKRVDHILNEVWKETSKTVSDVDREMVNRFRKNWEYVDKKSTGRGDIHDRCLFLYL